MKVFPSIWNHLNRPPITPSRAEHVRHQFPVLRPTRLTQRRRAVLGKRVRVEKDFAIGVVDGLLTVNDTKFPEKNQ